MALQQETPNPSPQEQAYVTIPKVIRLLLMAQGREQQDLAHHIGISPQSFSDRMAYRSTGFKAHHMAGIAEFLNVPVGDLFKPPEDLFSTKCYSENHVTAGQRHLGLIGQGRFPGIS